MEELLLIRQAQHGDVDAFNELVIHYQSRAYNLAYRIMGDAAQAADATQDAFISAYHHLEQYHGGSFRAWLMRIVTNACYDAKRHQKRRPAASLDEMTAESDAEPQLMLHYSTSEPNNPEHAFQQQALQEVIQGCLEGLTEDYRVVAVLADMQDYNYAEIAGIVQVPLGTIKSRLSRARQQLRDCLQHAGELLPAQYRLNKRNI